MSKDGSIESALKHVDMRRRGFLGKLLAGSASVAAVPAMSTITLGGEGQAGGKGKGGKGKGGKGKGGKGKGGKGKGGGRPEPAQMAQRLIREHDRDGDGALNANELASALQAIRSRRGGQGKGQGGFGGKGKGKGGFGGKGKGKGGKGKGRQ